MATSKKEVQAVFERFAKACGKEVCSTFPHKPGSWWLDYNPTYGGWAISEAMPTGTGERTPFGGGLSANRMPSGEFVRAMHFAINALEIKAVRS